MKLDRQTARALVEANLMPLKDYIEMFGTAEEIEAGEADALRAVRPRPCSEKPKKTALGFRREMAATPLAMLHCH